MQSIDLNRLIVMYMTTDVDRQLIDDRPPQLPFEPDTVYAKDMLEENVKHSAVYYDTYNPVVQLSFMRQGTADPFFAHFLCCAEPDYPTGTTEDAGRRISAFNTEKDLMVEASALVGGSVVETHDGLPVSVPTYAGWKIYMDIWPRLVNKAFAYGSPLPRSMMSDPLKRFSTLNNLLDVSCIYSQGMNLSMRRLPSLADTLHYWEYEQDVEYAIPTEIRDAICTEPLKAIEYVEAYLKGMWRMITRYYNLEKTDG